MIRDPESAVAAAICYLSRSTAKGIGYNAGRHPRRCGWCDYEPADLLRMVNDFNQADIDGHLSAPFRRLNANAQRSLVDAALYQQAQA